MKIRAGAAIVAVALAAASCTSDEPTAEETPAPEPTDAPPETTETPEAAPDPEDPLGDFHTQDVQWEECDNGFECATLTVPLDYAEADGETIELALLRIPAAGDDRIGSLFVNPGGPGGSGVEYAMQAETQLSEAVRERFDIVGFDPRGVANSTPIDCVSDAELDEFISADPVPDDAAELNELNTDLEEFAAGCEANSGAMLAHVNTENVARDLDIMRAALGDDVLYYLGKSYGTYIGALYAGLFPDNVGRLVLDGAMDPSLTSVEFALGQATGVDRALTAYLEDCVAQTECALGSSVIEARETVAGLLDVIENEPLPTSDPDRPLSAALATYGIILPLYVPPEQGYEYLTSGFEEALGGNGDTLLFLADVYLDRNADGTYNGNQNEAIFAVHCVDRPSLETAEEVEATLGEFEEASPIFGPFLAWSELSCASWPVEPVDEPEPVSAAGADPILVVGTTGDLATPYEWAEGLADQLESGVLLTYEGFGHTAYFTGNDCVDSVVDTYLIDGELPEGEQPVCS